MGSKRAARAVAAGPGRVGVLAALSDLNPCYSVAGVVRSQLRLLAEKGHKPVFVTTDDFKDPERLPTGVDVRTFQRYPGKVPLDSPTADFETYVALTSKALRGHLADCCVCLTHDLIFLPDFLPVNWAMRKAAADMPGLKWYHWIHSAPSQRPSDPQYPLIGCYSAMRNSELCYVNRTDVPRLAAMFAMPEAHIRVVHNMVDPEELLDLHPLTVEIMRKHALLAADVICVYPIRPTQAKQPDKILKLLASVKTLGNSVRIIVCNSYSNADNEKAYIADLTGMAEALGLNSTDVLFTSTFQSAWCKEFGHDIELGVPRRVVVDLLGLSDLFILPSVSEACSIIMLEAAMRKNLIVLNEDLFSLQEFGGQRLDQHGSGRCVYFSFGSLTRPVTGYNPSEEEWMRDHARALIDMISSDKTTQFFRHVRKHHTPEYIYHSQLAPLLG